jgi:hypothetical protein
MLFQPRPPLRPIYEKRHDCQTVPFLVERAGGWGWCEAIEGLGTLKRDSNVGIDVRQGAKEVDWDARQVGSSMGPATRPLPGRGQ